MINVYKKFPILFEAINYIIKNNYGDVNYYHNNIHMFETFKMCNDIINSLSDDELNNINELAIYLAALFHDYGHFGRMGIDDTLNIDRAKSNFIVFSRQHIELRNTELVDEVIRLIECTKYPNDITEYDLSMSIISDSDMNVVLSDNMLHIYQNLKKEFNLSDEEFFTNQLKFVNNLHFKTKYGQELWSIKKEEKIYEMKELAKCNGIYI